ncbi:MAG TPA: Druantia anti-phage system protein DruA [Flavisolibacter sp.]|nr:Druantia anti-phage system protein DruA [Flavisolibacter sp.]
MEKQVIDIAPKLNQLQQKEFINFCKNARKATVKASIEQRMQFLTQERERVNSTYNGKKFHSYADLLFLQNLLLDLLAQDWQLVVQRDKVRVELETLEEGDRDLDQEKNKTRRRHLLARDLQLKIPSVAEFIKSMERRRLTTKGWHSIFSVMRDGIQLRNVLEEIACLESEEERVRELSKTVKPYIQFVEPDKKCEETGLYLSDIWRYFRHTWISEYKSLPGRSLSILIRDAAAPNHPVIGIAALGSSVAQQTCRDHWIGWEGKSFLDRLKNNPSAKHAVWITDMLETLLKEVYLKDFLQEKIITRSQITKPTVEVIKQLRALSQEFRQKHIDNPHKAKFTVNNNEMSWEERAQTFLFKSKRAILLADLLSIKYVLNKYNFKGDKKQLADCLEKGDFCDAIERLVRKVKSIHVGINMMDIIICGSIAPYNHLLGGKLVCMMLTSPEVVQYYNSKYKDYVSLIASSMRGKAVVRVPQLVFLGTTSLYGVGSSQYNRIHIPTGAIGGNDGGRVEYRKLGYTEGFGSFHFSGQTIKLADAVAGRENGRTRVNSIFGEGANPLLRKLKDAMEHLKLESNPILNHRNRRVVYGISLAENFSEVLLGLANKAKYHFPLSKARTRSDLIANYWTKRWLLNRITNPEILERVSGHSLAYPVTHGARVPMVAEENGLTLFDLN